MRSVIALAAALVTSLVGAYLVATYEGSNLDASKVAVYVANTGDIQQITWTTELSTITLTQKSDDRGEYVWVQTTKKTEVPQDPIIPSITPDGDDHGHDHKEGDGHEHEDAPAPVVKQEPVYKTTESAFLGGDQAAKLLAKYTPLQAIRELPQDSSLDMGTDEPFGTVSVTRKSGVLDLVVGKKTPSGRQRFLKANDKNYLIGNADISGFQRSSKLMEKRVHTLGRRDAAKLVVTAGESSRTMVRQNAADLQKSFWSNPETPEAKDELGESWVWKALDITAEAYVGEEDVANAESAFTVTVSNDETSWVLNVVRVNQEGTEASYYGKSDFTRTWVKLSSKAADCANELDAFLSGTD